MKDVYRTKEGETIDEIAFRHYGRHSGTTEAVLEANPGLGEQPLTLPAGLEIKLPDVSKQKSRHSVKLYD